MAILRDLPGGVLRTATVVAGLGGAGLAFAEEPAASTVPAPARPAGVTDAILSGKVLKAKDQDPVLRQVNLVVSIVDGVAVIGGPVSSPAIAKRAEDLVRQVAPEIKEVRNACFVTAGPDPLLKAVAERMKPTSLPPRPSLTELPGVLSTPQPAGSMSSNQVAFGPGANTVVAQKPPVSTPGGNVLGAPVGSTGSGGGSSPVAVRDPSAPPGTAPGRLTGSNGAETLRAAGDILTSAGNVKRSDPRFARLTIELKDGILLIGGTAPKAADAWAFADQVRQIPGVTRVVMGATEAK